MKRKESRLSLLSSNWDAMIRYDVICIYICKVLTWDVTIRYDVSPRWCTVQLYTNLSGHLNKGKDETKECTPQVVATQCCMHWWQSTTGDMDLYCHWYVTEFILVSNVDDDGNIARVDARDTCDNDRVFNRVNGQKPRYPIVSWQRAYFVLLFYGLHLEHQCASAHTGD